MRKLSGMLIWVLLVVSSVNVVVSVSIATRLAGAVVKVERSAKSAADSAAAAAQAVGDARGFADLSKREASISLEASRQARNAMGVAARLDSVIQKFPYKARD